MPIHGLHVDVHEPLDLINLVGQSVPLEVRSINSEGWADYIWETYDGVNQLERKTWADMLASVSSIEQQLQRQIAAHPESKLMLLVEGIAVPAVDMMGGTAIATRTKAKPNIFYSKRQSYVSLQAMYAWLYQVSKYMEVYCTPDIEATAKAIVAFYTSDLKGEHKTLHRHIKEVQFHPNPQVTSLMGLIHGLGPIKGEALIATFGTVWNVVSASPQELAKVHGVGPNEARKWLQRLGRPDV
jgi:ERCC4-type nuclease